MCKSISQLGKTPFIWVWVVWLASTAFLVPQPMWMDIWQKRGWVGGGESCYENDQGWKWRQGLGSVSLKGCQLTKNPTVQRGSAF